MTTKNRYNMYNLDVRVKNINELNEAEYGLFNQQAKEAAERLLSGISRMSSDYQEQVAKWVSELDGQRRRDKTKFEKQRFAADQSRDESGRYKSHLDEQSGYTSEPNAFFPDEGQPNPYDGMLAEGEDDELVRLVQAYKARKQAAIESNNPNPSPRAREFGDNLNDTVLGPGMQWAMRDGKTVQIPKHEAQARREYAPGTGSGLPISPIGNGVGNMASLSPEQINKALGKRGNR